MIYMWFKKLIVFWIIFFHELLELGPNRILRSWDISISRVWLLYTTSHNKTCFDKLPINLESERAGESSEKSAGTFSNNCLTTSFIKYLIRTNIVEEFLSKNYKTKSATHPNVKIHKNYRLNVLGAKVLYNITW